MDSAQRLAEAEGDKDFWRLLIAFFAPPLGVWMQVGFRPQFWLNVILTVLLFWVGGQIHAAYVITTTDASGGEQDGGLERFFAVLLAAFLPPAGVLINRGVSMALLLNVLLWILFWFPGALHALWLITHDE